MFTTQARKAYVAALIAGLTAATLAASGGISLEELFIILGALVAGFQATYWTKNEKSYDGSVDVVNVEGKKTFMLNLDSDPESLDTKSDISFKINPA